MRKLFENRYTDLKKQLNELSQKVQRKYSDYQGEHLHIEEELLTNWSVKTKNLILQTCGVDSIHYKSYEKADINHHHSDNVPTLNKLRAIFMAAEEDYVGGYVKSIESIIHGEIFDDEIEQAEELLKHGYIVAAAVIAGVVLETFLRNKCKDRNLEVGMIDSMNVSLAKDAFYDKLVQKRITALADIRNKAAHGVNTFEKSDVVRMIQEVREIVSRFNEAL